MNLTFTVGPVEVHTKELPFPVHYIGRKTTPAMTLANLAELDSIHSRKKR